MKKTLLFLSCLLLLLAGCSQNELDQDYASGGEKAQSNKIRWYGTKLSEGVQARGVADGSKRWNQDAGIYIKFINTPADQTVIDRIKQTAAEWEEYAGIKFHFVEQNKKADVRIAFDWNNNDWLTWSYTGNDAKLVADQNEPTAVFGGIEYLDDTEFRGDVLRLFGQILGLEYEQRHEEWSKNSYWKDAAQLQAYWEDQFEGYSMDWDQIRQYVFEPLTTQSTNQLLETKEIDELSVMAWPYYNRKQTSKLLANYELSESDQAFIARLYPKTAITLPTIQEAWIDAGYFTWTDVTKTALRITQLGIEQEYLPDVSDGKQLKSATNMFVSPLYLTKTKLRRAPLFDTSNITSFRGMFAECTSLTSIPEFNTSKGIDFSTMFADCPSLTTIPKLNTSNGTNFSGMFDRCRSLTTVPTLDVSNGTGFNMMFTSCTSLITIPELDTSQGINFSIMFGYCTSLASTPKLNTSKGTLFNAMFVGCTSLTTITELDTSNGIDFSAMFWGCTALSSIPKLDTSNSKIFSMMFSGCTALITIPELDTSNSTSFNMMFYDCKSLTNIPRLNTSKGTNFESMFSNCSSLISKPQIDLSNATDTQDMFKGTPWG